METKKLRLGVLGAGNMGATHIKNVLAGKCPEIEIAAVSDAKPERLAWAKETLGADVPCFESAEAMLDSGLIDACLVCVRHYEHPQYVIACIERGIHVLCEKPAGVYTKQVREMNAVAAAHPDVVFGMMFNQRTNCVYRKLKELVDSGKYGAIRRTNWIITNWYRPQAYYDSGEWRATWAGEGGGVLLNQCPHQLDLLQWITGLPTLVDAHLHFGKWHDIEVEDDVTAYLEYANGATGVFITSTGDACGTNRFEIQLDGAKLVVEDGKQLFAQEFPMTEQEFSRTNVKPFGSMKCEMKEVETDGENPQHPAVMNAFADAILHGGKLVARGEEGLRGLILSNAMHLSAFLGKPVEIPFDDDLYYEELQKRVRASKRKTSVRETTADLDGTFRGTDSK